MEGRVEMTVMELAGLAGVSVDTVRYYQGLGLLRSPARSGRQAVYGDEHLDRLKRIRSMAERGFSLKAIRAILDGDAGAPADDTDAVLQAAIERESGGAAFSSAELAARVGIPAALLRSIEGAGLVEGQVSEAGEPVYSEADIGVAKGALQLLHYGFPLTELLSLAVAHNRATRETVDRAIDLFDDHVRKRGGSDGAEESEQSVVQAFEELLPIVTALVAHHFQRVLVNRALKRLKKSGQKRQLDQALRATRKARFKLRWR
jgi:DNA-binding transcriptional MerR regulator